MSIVNDIRATAARQLGRPARRRGRRMDWAAVDAVRAAAREHGLTEPLAQWVTDASLTGLAAAYVGRYQQAYGVGVGMTAGYVDQAAERQTLGSLAAVA